MLYNNHHIELLVNGTSVEFNSQDLSISFNRILADPTKITCTQAEYSFTFTLPCTPNNNKIFDYANNLSKVNKFRPRYNAELYADSTLIFSGSLTVTSIKDNAYNVNLVSVKNYSLSDLFGDTTMENIRPMQRDSNGNILRDSDGNILHKKWDIPFDGAPSINAINASGDTNVMFPLVCYGAFPKKTVSGSTTLPSTRPIYYGNYTSKFDFDNYNLWYYETFYPSHSLMQTLKYAFETKDYVVAGDAFQNPFLNDIYMSVNLADGQVPTYNLGNPKFGKAEINVRWICPQDSTTNSADTFGTTSTLKFPTMATARPLTTIGGSTDDKTLKFNCEQVRVYDMMQARDGGSATTTSNSYMYDNGDCIVVIPSDGFYKINLTVNAKLNQTEALTAAQWQRPNTSAVPSLVDATFNPNFRITTPLEIQLVRNWDEGSDGGIELIKGENGIIIMTGDPDHLTTPSMFGTHEEFTNVYPHEKIGSALIMSQPTASIEPYLGESIIDNETNMGFVPKSTDPMAYDPFVSNKFICGFSSWGNTTLGGTGAVIRNGHAWSHIGATEKAESFYNCSGYTNMLPTQQGASFDSNKNKNIYPGATYSFNETTNTMTGTIQCLVKLNRNDILRLIAVHRDYETSAGTKVSYSTSATCYMTIEAASPNDNVYLQTRMEQGLYSYSSATEFDVNLNLANFFNKETKISDWVEAVQNAFNLEIIQNTNSVTINTKKRPQLMGNAVNLDDRINTSNIEVKKIDYPKSMAIAYKLNEEEWGAESSAIETYGGEAVMNRDDWQKYIDSGYTTIQLNDDSFVTNTEEKSLKFAYTWYDWFEYFSADTQTQGLQFKIPVISKYTYMIDGYDYEDSRKHDGYGLTQRFWFKPSLLDSTIQLPIKDMDEYVRPYITKNYKGNFNLSYKTNEVSILSEFFNIQAFLASNYIKASVYVTPSEYNMLSNGAMLHVDDDLYNIVQIENYNPTDGSCEITAMKSVI